MVAQHDEAIPPDGHLAMVSHPAEVVALIKEVAETVRRSSTESAAAAPHA
jgi:hypothetical protein